MSTVSTNKQSSPSLQEDDEESSPSSSSLSAHRLALSYADSLSSGHPLAEELPHVAIRQPIARHAHAHAHVDPPKTPQATATATAPTRLELGGKTVLHADADGIFTLEKPKARINKLLRADEFAHIFSFLDGMSIAPLNEVCHEWCAHVHDPLTWRVACQQTWWCESDERLERKCKKYGDDWRRMFIERHHVRYDGYYCLETVYWQPGGFGFGQRQDRVSKVSYYRYLQFRPNGKIYYCLTNYEPDPDQGIPLSDKCLSQGTYKFNHESIAIKVDIVGHMMCWILLNFMNVSYLTGVHNRLEFKEFYGQGAKDRAPICFNITSTLFKFYRFRKS